MLMRPNKADTAVHYCNCPGDMVVRMRKVLARPRGCTAFVYHLLFLFTGYEIAGSRLPCGVKVKEKANRTTR